MRLLLDQSGRHRATRSMVDSTGGNGFSFITSVTTRLNRTVANRRRQSVNPFMDSQEEDKRLTRSMLHLEIRDQAAITAPPKYHEDRAIYTQTPNVKLERRHISHSMTPPAVLNKWQRFPRLQPEPETPIKLADHKQTDLPKLKLKQKTKKPNKSTQDLAMYREEIKPPSSCCYKGESVCCIF